MFTLQILDRGQTFLHTIEGRPLLLGSGNGADVILREDGVEAAHARLEPGNGSVRLVALAKTQVNGQPVAQVDLSLGDRVEIGRAVLIVGRTVARAAKPEDVLADALPREGRRQGARKKRWWPPLLVAAAAAAVVVWLVLGTGGVRVADELAMIRRARQDGQLERALASIEKLERAWADASDDRLQRLSVERDAVGTIENAIDRMTAAVVDPADSRGYAEWSQELRRIEIEGDDAERVAARRVRSQLTETLRKRPPPTPALAASPAPKAPPSPPTAAGPADARTPAPTAVPGPPPSPRTIDFAEVDRLCTQGLFAQAFALLQANLAAADDQAGVALLNARIGAVREQAKQAMAKVLDEAAQVMRGGKPADAGQLLQSVQHRFPATGEFAAIARQIAAAEAAVAAAARPVPVPAPVVDQAARAATLATVRAQMDAVRAAEEKGAFADAAQRLRAAAASLRERDAEFAERLLARADEAELLASWHDAVAAAVQGGRKFTARSRSGLDFEITRVEGGTLFPGAPDETALTWLEISPSGVQAIADQLAITGREALGAAALIYKAGDNKLAEAMLATLLRADAGLKVHVDRVIARGRGDLPDPRGYSLGKDGFVSVRSLELQKEAQKLAARLDAAMRDKNPAPRAALVAEAKAGGSDGVQVLVLALRKDFDKQVQKLEAGQLRKQLDRLDRQRVLLDEARKDARDLIYDEDKYFYPYRPPAVSSDRYAEYVRVQAEVDRRVAALRTRWQDDHTRVRVPAGLRADLDRLDWVANELAMLGELDSSALSGIAWARSLPAGDSVSVRDYCRTEEERAELEEWRRVEAYNQVVGKDLSSAQREQLRILNEYRAMFRHRPLAVVKELCAAAQGHAEEMSRLGYFAHESPTPGRKWPHDRTKLAGYPFGSSENIALVDGAQGAHDAWCHSSGHHRNLLQPNHREVGIGAEGRYWVQNFGSGKVHREHPAWDGAGTRKR